MGAQDRRSTGTGTGRRGTGTGIGTGERGTGRRNDPRHRGVQRTLLVSAAALATAVAVLGSVDIAADPRPVAHLHAGIGTTPGRRDGAGPAGPRGDRTAGADGDRAAGADGDGEAATNPFRRFRSRVIDGAHLRPARDDLAARTVPGGPLLVFLPATRAAPADYSAFLTAATTAGYHVLGLDYWNLGRTLSGTCRGRAHCYTRVQRNRFDGTSPTRHSRVQPAGSIVSRLRDAIHHLSDVDPAGGWDRFVRGDRVQWRDIVVAGHSQGGSEAAFIGHIRSVQGVLMFGAPAVSHGHHHASWLDRPGATPPSRIYALAHVDDEFEPAIRPSWAALDLDGARRPFVSRNAVPVGDPHVLETTVAVPPGDRAHGIVVGDRTPRDALGNAVLLPVWRWLLTRFGMALTHPQASSG